MFGVTGSYGVEEPRSQGCSANVGGVPVQTGVRDCNRGEASVVAAFYARLGTLPVRVNTNRIAL